VPHLGSSYTSLASPAPTITQQAQEIVQQPRGRKGLKNLANVLVENDGGRIGRRAVTLDAWRKMMSVLRPDLISNPWIYDLMFVASSNSIKTSEQFKEDPTINYKVRRLGSLCCWARPAAGGSPFSSRPATSSFLRFFSFLRSDTARRSFASAATR
jgi:hypothetical protein